MNPQILPWLGFNVFVLAMLALDLGVFHRKAHVMRVREALAWSAIWITLALLFNVGLYFWKGPEPALQFFTGYLIEKSLSVDNLFVFLVLFSFFKVAPVHQHKVLFWGILGALGMRAAMIAVGAQLITRFHGVIYVFGAILLLSALKLAFQKGDGVHPERNVVVRLFRSLVPMTPDYRGASFLVREEGKLLATPLLLVLVTVEFTDLVFAVDSIPAIFAVTEDPFIVYTSNVFAILGLRSLFFALAGFMSKFHYLRFGLAAILAFVGGKMMLADVIKLPTPVSLAVIVGLLGLSVGASLAWPPRKEDPPPTSEPG